MGDVYKGDPQFALHLFELNLHFLAHLEIESPKRFVKQQHLRQIYQGAGDGNALHLTAGELVNGASSVALQFNQIQHLTYTFVDFLLGQLFYPQAKGDILGYVEMGEESIALEDSVELTFMRLDCQEISPLEGDRAAVRLLKTSQNSQRGGFAAAGGTQQGKEFIAADIKSNILHNLSFTEGLVDFDKLNDVRLPRLIAQLRANHGCFAAFFCRQTHTTIFLALLFYLFVCHRLPISSSLCLKQEAVRVSDTRTTASPPCLRLEAGRPITKTKCSSALSSLRSWAGWIPRPRAPLFCPCSPIRGVQRPQSKSSHPL